MGHWRREGNCNHCGQCCKVLMRMPHMLRHPNFMNPSNYCKYLFQKDDGKWYCDIQEAIEDKDTEFLKMIPQLDYEYWIEECKDYPNPNKPAHVLPKHHLLPSCGFKIVINNV